MRLTLFFLLVAIFQGRSEGFSQNRITLLSQNESLKTILKEFRRQSGFHFVYSQKVVKAAGDIDINIKDATLTEALDKCLEGQSLSYSIIDNTVVLKIKDPEITDVKNELAQIILHGLVKDSKTGMPLAGVSVQIKGKAGGTVTDANGAFSLRVAENAVLIVSYVGYTSAEIPVNGRSDLSIPLSISEAALDQYVVVGYGTQKKADLTGAVATLDIRQLQDRPIPNLSQGLQGLIPGVTIARNSGGAPGSSAKIQIRGFTSLNSEGPLVLIDGVPGKIDNLNPDDVASISVLKDAASAAIYGARAAEGVILITTKGGSYDKPFQVSYKTNISIQKPGRYPEVNNSIDNATMGNLAFTNAGNAPLYQQQQIDAYKDPSIVAYPDANNTDYVYVANTNWPKLLFNDALQQSHQLALSGGSQNINYRVSGEFFNQNGMFAKYGPDNFYRKTLRANLSAKLIPSKLSMQLGIDYFNAKDQAPAPGYTTIMSATEQTGPNIPVYNPDGTYARYRMQQNPIQLLKEAGFDNTYSDQLTGRFSLDWNISKALSVNALGSYRINYVREKQWHRAYGKYRPTGVSNIGYINQPNSVTQNNNFSAYSLGQVVMNYKNTFAQNHHINFLVGSSIEQQKNSYLTAFRDNISGNELPALNIGSNANWKNGATEGSWAIVSGFSRINYDFKDKYLLEANVRIDGSSRFSKSHRWGTFPSISAGWRISKEAFMASQQLFSDLKLRLSWGQTGNQAGLGLYDYVPVYNIGGYYPFGGGNLGQWAVSPQLASENRTWETVEVKNIGIDMGFIQNRLSFSADYFIKRNNNMLINIQVPSMIGIGVPTGNYGVLDTKGWEAQLSWNDNISNDLSYSVSFNLSDSRNKLISLATTFAKPTSGIINLQGYPLGSIFGYQAVGYFQSQDEVTKWATQSSAVNGPGDIKYADQDGDNKISAPNDLVYMGNTSPRYTYGLNLGLRYRSFDFSAFLQGVGKRDYYLTSGDPGIAPFIHPWDNYSFKIQNDYWKADNPNALFPRPYLGGQNYQYSTHWLQNAAYIRLKNIQLGYSLSKRFCEKIGAEEIRLYFSGADIWTSTKLIMYDPEISNSSGYFYPNPKSYSFGLNVAF